MSASGYVHIEVKEILRETDKAFQIKMEDDSEYWIPKSHVSDSDNYSAGDMDCSMSITEWMAKEKGIEGE